MDRGAWLATIHGVTELDMAYKVAACGIVFPDQGLNPGFLNWERGVSATGLSGKSQEEHFLFPVEAPVLVQVLNMFVFN